jgi:hypothetical protein
MVSIVSDRVKMTFGPSITAVNRVNIHSSMGGCRENLLDLVLGGHALLRMLRAPESRGLAAALESLRLLDWGGKALPATLE